MLKDQVIQNIQFMTKNEKKNKWVCWCKTNTVKGVIDFIQYVLDNCNSHESYVALDIDNGKPMTLVAMAEMLGMRKRTFEERMECKETYDMAKIEELLR